MPSPSKFSLVTGAVVSAGLVYGGAYLASEISTGETAADAQAPRESYMPAPVPERFEPETPGEDDNID